MELYKYCDKNGINVLKHKALKLSSIDDWNDPFEFRIGKSNNNNINEAVDAIYNYQKKAYRVICFTYECNNLIMWNHYSKSHTGILLKFDTTLILVNENKKLSDFLEEVDYRDDMIEIPDNFLELDGQTKEKIINKNTYRKYTDWQYESEYRAIVAFDHIENKRYIDITPESILEVILGLNCDLDTELNIKGILKKDEYSHIKFKRAFINEKKYEMKYIDIEI